MAKQLDSSEYSRNNVERYHKRAAGKGIRKGIVAFIVVALLAALGGTAFAAVNWVKSLDERLHNEEVVDDELRAVLTEPAAPSDPYYVLLLGTDGRAGEEDFRQFMDYYNQAKYGEDELPADAADLAQAILKQKL